MLALYDENYNLLEQTDVSSIIRTIHNGKPGGADHRKLHIRNDDSSTYYTDLIAVYVNELNEDYGVLGSTGWSVKLLYGSRQPTESEWDSVQSGDSIELPDIGNTQAANTYTYFPFWIRVYCPGGSPAQVREGQEIRIYYNEHKVGA